MSEKDPSGSRESKPAPQKRIDKKNEARLIIPEIKLTPPEQSAFEHPVSHRPGSRPRTPPLSPAESSSANPRMNELKVPVDSLDLKDRVPPRPPISTPKSPLRLCFDTFHERIFSMVCCCCYTQNEDKVFKLQREGGRTTPQIRLKKQIPSSADQPAAEPAEQIPVNNCTCCSAERIFVAHARQFTHYYGTHVTPEQTFFVTKKKIKAAKKYLPKLEQKLGIHVRMLERRERINVSDSPASNCEQCPLNLSHYICSCQPKYMDTGWCSHIHLFYRLTNGFHYKNVRLYVHEEWKPTEMRHLRAFVQGENFMVYRGKGVYETAEAELSRVDKYQVLATDSRKCVCLSDRKCQLCGACRCRYTCTCDDFAEYRHVCQHTHNVAMKRQSPVLHPFEKLFEFEAGYAHTLAPSLDLNRGHYIDEEHDMSYNLGKIEQILHLHSQHKDGSEVATAAWNVHTKGKSEFFQVTSLVSNQCHCPRTKNLSPAVACFRCRMCAKHYKCTCVTGKYLICRHMHAVQRKVQQIVENPSDIWQKFNRMGPVEEMSSGGGTCVSSPSGMRTESGGLRSVEDLADNVEWDFGSDEKIAANTNGTDNIEDSQNIDYNIETQDSINTDDGSE